MDAYDYENLNDRVVLVTGGGGVGRRNVSPAG